MLLALDLATTTGWCAGDGSSLPSLGSVTMPKTGEENGPYFDFFFRWMHAKISELQAEFEVETEPGDFGPRSVDRKALICAIEAPMLPAARYNSEKNKWEKTTNLATTRKLQGLAGFAETICYQRNVLCEEVYASQVKSAIGGSGKAAKPDMMAAAKKCGLNPPTHDAADAFGVWVLMMRAYARQYQHQWDQRLYGGRGLL